MRTLVNEMRPISVSSVAYDPSTNTATLTFAKPTSVSKEYQLFLPSPYPAGPVSSGSGAAVPRYPRQPPQPGRQRALGGERCPTASALVWCESGHEEGRAPHPLVVLMGRRQPPLPRR